MNNTTYYFEGKINGLPYKPKCLATAEHLIAKKAEWTIVKKTHPFYLIEAKGFQMWVYDYNVKDAQKEKERLALAEAQEAKQEKEIKELYVEHYKKIPDATQYGINKNGQVIKFGETSELHKIIRPVMHKDRNNVRHLVAKIVSDNGKKSMLRVSVIMARVFMPDYRIRKHKVLFLDGDRKNCALYNLYHVSKHKKTVFL